MKRCPQAMGGPAAAALLALLAGSSVTARAQAAARPNIVLILADDLGFSMVGAGVGSTHGEPGPSPPPLPDVRPRCTLQEISRGGDRDDDPGPCVAFAARVADQLLDRLGRCAGEITEQLPPAAEQRAEQTWNGKHHLAVCDGALEQAALEDFRSTRSTTGRSGPCSTTASYS